MSDDPSRHLAQALGRVPSGLFVLTARTGSGDAAMLASWVQQCSFDPPQLSVALRAGRGMLDVLADGASLTVNVLPEGAKDLLAHFGKGFAPGESAFDGVELTTPDGSAGPVLARALAWLDCRVAGRHPAGDHELVVAKVVAGGVLHEGRPATHVRKSGLHY